MGRYFQHRPFSGGDLALNTALFTRRRIDGDRHRRVEHSSAREIMARAKRTKKVVEPSAVLAEALDTLIGSDDDDSVENA